MTKKRERGMVWRPSMARTAVIPLTCDGDVYLMSH